MVDEPRQTTWDGEPVADEPPFGATVVVYRRDGGTTEFLLLHRAHRGPDYEGDWAWTPPAGARKPGEPIEDCARRELFEETRLSLAIVASRHAAENWHVYSAETEWHAEVVLDGEHDRFEWVSVEQALAICRPERVAADLEAVASMVAAGGGRALD